MRDYTFLELGDGQKILSKGKAINVSVVTIDLTFRFDLTIMSLLHDVDLIVGISWLLAINNPIDWRYSWVFLSIDAGTSVLLCD